MHLIDLFKQEDKILKNLTINHVEKAALYSLLAFPIVDYILRHWIKFGGGLWDKAAIGFLLILAIIYKFQTDRVETNLKKPFIAYIMFGIALLFLNMHNFPISLEGFRAVFQFMVTFLIGYYLFRKRVDWIYSIRFLLIVGFIVALYGLAQPYLGVQMPSGWVDSGEAQRFRAFSIVQSPNVLGSFMALLIPIGIGLFFAEKDKKWKMLWTGIVFVLLLCLLATYSRGAWLAFAAAITFFAILIDRRALIAVIIGGIIIVAFVPGVTDRVTYLFSDTYIERSSADGRIARWSKALDQAKSEPFLGRGLGHYGGAVAERNLGVTYVDNFYAKTVAETGLVGLSLFLWLIFATLFKGYNKIQNTKDKQLRWMMRGILTGLIAVTLHNGVENIFEVPFMTVYYWFLAGSLLAAPLLITERGEAV